jgi:hypothetical protein
LENALGEYEYKKLIATYGEDSVLDLALQATEQYSTSSTYVPPPKRTGPWKTAFLVLWNLNTATGYYLLIGVASAGVPGVISIVALYFIMVVLAATGYLESAGTMVLWLVGTALVLGVIGLIGYGAWTGVPWLTSGVFQWFKWLGNHT